MVILYLQKPEVLASQREEVEDALAELGDVEVRFGASPEEARQHRDAEVVIAPSLPWLPEALAGLPNVHWIHFLSAGVDRLWSMDVPWSRYRLSKSVGVHAATVTEYVLGAILYALKGFGTFGRQQQRREWRRFWLDECAGKTVGIIGVGTIGTRLAQHAKALGMTVVGTATTPRDIPHVDAVFVGADLEEVLRRADFVVVLVPLTSETRGLINARAFEVMKKNAWLINVARGEIVNEAAMVGALQGGAIGGAVLDVFEDEPLPVDSPLWDLENVLITPHVAGTTQHYIPRSLEVFRANYRKYVRSGDLVTPVSIEKGY